MTTVLKMLDLFCGTKSMAKAFERAGWETYTIDWDDRFDESILADIGDLCFTTVGLEKTDKDTNKLLNGAVFSLYTKDGKLVEKNITTMHGKILVEKLAPGKYYLVETKAPSGYIKSDQKYNFEITTEFAGQPDLEIIKITNKEDVLPTTGVDYSLIALVLVTISSLVGIRYYYREN